MRVPARPASALRFGSNALQTVCCRPASYERPHARGSTLQGRPFPPPPMPKIFPLVLAAGQGPRIGDAVPKQYTPVAGKPMMFHSIEALASVSRVERVLVVLAPLDRHWGSYDWSALPDKGEGIFCGGSRPAHGDRN